RAAVHLARIDGDLVRPAPRDLRAERLEDHQERLDVPDARHVAERDGLGREHGRGEARQGGILVAGGPNPALEPVPALDHEGPHRLRDTGWLEVGPVTGVNGPVSPGRGRRTYLPAAPGSNGLCRMRAVRVAARGARF